MTCTSCKREFNSERAGFIVCPYCGHVNGAANSAQHVVIARGEGPPVTVHLASKKRRALNLSLKNPGAIVGIALSVLVLGGVTAAYSVHLHHQQTAKVATVSTTTKTTVHTRAAQTTQNPTPTTTSTSSQTAPVTKPKTSPSITTTVPSLDETVSSINQKLSRFGVTATLTPSNNAGTASTWSTLTASDASTLRTFSTYLTDEFGKYPTDMVTNSGLKTIGLVKSLQVSGGARAAAPAPSITGMLYDVNSMTNAGSEYAREVVSHEYWHYMDYKMKGSYWYDDTIWDACNPATFHYGAGGATAYGPNSGYVAAFHPTADFITAYSEYGIEEDRAEMFGWLIYSPSKVKSLNDIGINCKISRLTTIIHQLSPGMSF